MPCISEVCLEIACPWNMVWRPLTKSSQNERCFQLLKRFDKQIGLNHISFEIDKSVNHDHASITQPCLHPPARNDPNSQCFFRLNCEAVESVCPEQYQSACAMVFLHLGVGWVFCWYNKRFVSKESIFRWALHQSPEISDGYRWKSLERVGKVFNDEGNFCQGEERNAFKVVGNQLFPS